MTGGPTHCTDYTTHQPIGGKEEKVPGKEGRVWSARSTVSRKGPSFRFRMFPMAMGGGAGSETN